MAFDRGKISARIGGGGIRCGNIRDGTIIGNAVPAEATIPAYTGPYVFTPGDEEQVIPIARHVSTRDIVVEKIPSNYGKITFNGFYIMVS